MPFLGPEGRKQLKTFGRIGTVGIELVVSTVIGYLGGQWLDGVFDTSPVLEWLGLACGLLSGFRSLYRVARKTQRELTKQAEDSK